MPKVRNIDVFSYLFEIGDVGKSVLHTHVIDVFLSRCQVKSAEQNKPDSKHNDENS